MPIRLIRFLVWPELAALAFILIVVGYLWWHHDWTGGHLVLGSFLLGRLIGEVQTRVT